MTVIVFFKDGHFEVFEDVSDLRRRDGRLEVDGRRDLIVFEIARVEVGL